MKPIALTLCALAACLTSQADVVLENPRCKLTVGDDAIVRSLVLKRTGEELADVSEPVPLVTVTQDRLYNNEIKLAYPSRETTCRANRLRREGDELVVGFEILPYEARIRVSERDDSLGFELAGFDVELRDYQLAPQFPRFLDMKLPPVKRLRFLGLPVRNRRWFGEWLNVSWDDSAAVAVVATDPLVFIGNERERGRRILWADCDASHRLEGAKAALVVSSGAEFLDCLAAVEREHGLPEGVAARRSGAFNHSVYWAIPFRAADVERHIRLAKRGGFRYVLLMSQSLCNAGGTYVGVGDYIVHEDFGGDIAGIRKLVARFKAEGLTLGLHVLHPFVGFNTRRMRPRVDHRVNLKRHFTLARPIAPAGGDVYVEENPFNCPTNELSRYLVFNGEMLSYEGFVTERPYRFTGVRRGANGTTPTDHPLGQIGGLLDVTEFMGKCCYVNEDTSLQDELADSIAAIYNTGFEFLVMDGCEGVNAPFELNVPRGQYRVWKKLSPAPLFTEGAAKAHFAWHHLSGGNAFDVFLPEEFKRMIVRWPQHESALLAQDFSKVNFGWWGIWQPGARLADGTETVGTQPDMWEFGTSRAAAWDSPVTIEFDADAIERHPRGEDLLEVMRRWEDVRNRNWLTPEQKAALKSPTQEHHLYLNDRGEYELHEIEMLPTYPSAPEVRGFSFTRGGRRVFAYWNARAASAEVELPWGPNGTPVKLVAAGLKYFH